MLFYSIAIDGPAGSGKSSVAKQLAKELNFDYISSGNYYRAIGLYCLKNRINYAETSIFTSKFLEKNIKFDWDGKHVYLNNELLDEELNTSRIDQVASVIATIPNIREFINQTIRELTNKRSIIVDGRDIGTIVLPNATVKFFLDADPKTRAIRRSEQCKKRGSNVSVNDALNEIIERDNRDYNREIAPLKKADDAFYVDSSLLSFEQTVERLKHLYMGKIINETWPEDRGN